MPTHAHSQALIQRAGIVISKMVWVLHIIKNMLGSTQQRYRSVVFLVVSILTAGGGGGVERRRLLLGRGGGRGRVRVHWLD